MNLEKRRQFNERFLQRLIARRPQDRPEIEQRLQQEERQVVHEAGFADVADFADLTLGPTGQIRRDPRDRALETIVNRERPVLFVRDGKFDLNEVTALGPEAVDLVDRMRQQGSRLFSLLPLIVNRDGLVEKRWRGQLSSAQGADIMKALDVWKPRESPPPAKVRADLELYDEKRALRTVELPALL